MFPAQLFKWMVKTNIILLLFFILMQTDFQIFFFLKKLVKWQKTSLKIYKVYCNSSFKKIVMEYFYEATVLVFKIAGLI